MEFPSRFKFTSVSSCSWLNHSRRYFIFNPDYITFGLPAVYFPLTSCRLGLVVGFIFIGFQSVETFPEFRIQINYMHVLDLCNSSYNVQSSRSEKSGHYMWKRTWEIFKCKVFASLKPEICFKLCFQRCHTLDSAFHSKKKNGGKALKTFSFANTNDPNKYAATEFWELHVMHSFIKEIFDLAHSPIYNRNRNFSCFNIFPH